MDYLNKMNNKCVVLGGVGSVTLKKLNLASPSLIWLVWNDLLPLMYYKKHYILKPEIS